MVTEQYKLIVRATKDRETVQLFDLYADPGETVNLAPLRPELVRELKRLMAYEASETFLTEKVSIDKATQQKLEALGYIQ